MNSEQTAALHDARQALHCLNLEAPASVVRDISAKVEAAFAALSKPVPAADVATKTTVLDAMKRYRQARQNNLDGVPCWISDVYQPDPALKPVGDYHRDQQLLADYAVAALASPAPSRDSGKCGRCAKPADVYATKSGYGYLCAWCMQCEIIALQAKVEKLSAVQPSRDSGLREAGLDAIRQWWTLVEAQAELSEDGPLEDGNIALHFMGSGASASVTVGQVRAALAASPVDDDVERLRRENAELREACDGVAPWLSAMIEDGASCREFIQSAERFIAALQAVKQ